MIRVVAGLLRHHVDPRFVLVGERSGRSYPGFWEFPGGKVEDGETDQEALEREWREELGISITAGDPIATLVFHQPVLAPDGQSTPPFSITLCTVQYEDVWGIIKEDRWKLDSHSRMGWLSLDAAVPLDRPPGGKYRPVPIYTYVSAAQYSMTAVFEFVPSMSPFLNMIAAMEQK